MTTTNGLRDDAMFYYQTWFGAPWNTLFDVFFIDKKIKCISFVQNLQVFQPIAPKYPCKYDILQYFTCSRKKKVLKIMFTFIRKAFEMEKKSFLKLT